MARMQSGRLSWVIATTVFGIAFAFALILAIIFGLHVTGADQEAQKAATELDQVATSQERKNTDYTSLLQKAQQGRTSVYSLLSAENKLLKTRIALTPDATIDAVKGSITDTLKDDVAAGLVNQDQSLLQAYKAMSEQYKSEVNLLTQLKTDLKTAQDSATAAVAAKEAAAKQYDTSVEGLKGQIDSITKDLQGYKDQSDAKYAKVFQDFDANIDKLQKQAKALQGQVDQKTQEVAIKDHRIHELENVLGRKSGGPVDPSLLADGHVTSVYGDGKVAYIDRGKKDRITLGMTFEVFDPATGVVADSAGTLRGKATIEVNNVMEDSAVCRVVRRDPGKVVAVGDVIANAVYDPNMKFKFLVFGDFDLDDTGQATATDRRRVETMITQWGGTLVKIPTEGQPHLSYDVDFLVLGQEPPVPQAPRDPSNPDQVKQFAQAQERYSVFQDLLKEAKDLSIPVLNQNRFLVMVGYYKR